MTKYIDPPYFFIFNIQFNCNHCISLVILCGRKSTKSGVTPLKRCSGKIVSGLIYLSIRCCPVSPKISNSLSLRIALPLFLGIISFWHSSRIVSISESTLRLVKSFFHYATFQLFFICWWWFVIFSQFTNVLFCNPCHPGLSHTQLKKAHFS